MNSLIKILVVDDNREIRGVVSKMLSRMGFDVLATDSGEKGLDLFLKNRFDLVITDFDMPGMDGINLAFHIKKNSPYTAVILVTGHDKESLPTGLDRYPVDQTLFKPFGFGEIEATIQKALNQ